MNNSTIDASVHDDEEGSGEVTFYPFETEPVPCAPATTRAGPPASTTADAVIALEIAVGSRPIDLHWDISGDAMLLFNLVAFPNDQKTTHVLQWV